MNRLEMLKKLERYVIFNLDTVKNIIQKDEPYTKLLLYRLKKSGLIFQIERNKYTIHKNAFLIASHIIWPSYISLWSALRYYNLTEQIPHSFWVVSPAKRGKRAVRHLDTEIIFVSCKPKYFFGFKKINYNGFEIFIAEPEKAIIDGLLLKRISSSETYSIIKNNLKNIRTKKLVDFAIETGNKALIKRLGFLLDRAGADYIEKLKKYIYPVYTRVEHNLPSRGWKNTKWKVIENVVL